MTADERRRDMGETDTFHQVPVVEASREVPPGELFRPVYIQTESDAGSRDGPQLHVGVRQTTVARPSCGQREPR